MPCFNPLRGYRAKDGTVVFHEMKRHETTSTLTVRCGQCIGCRFDRSRNWAIRCVHESKSWPVNSWVTLTYDKEHLPVDWSLNYEHFQLFMKRLRFANQKRTIRFFVAGEYGGRFSRPHFHACLFNIDWKDTYNWRGVMRSPSLEKLWGMGHCVVGPLNFETAAYTARYVLEKINGDLADDHYKFVVPDTGEIVQRTPEFCHMSLKPGIGAYHYDKNLSDMYPRGKVVFRRRTGEAFQSNTPRYYDKLFKRDTKFDPLHWDDLVTSRQVPYEHGKSIPSMASQEAVFRARISQLKRNLGEFE